MRPGKSYQEDEIDAGWLHRYTYLRLVAAELPVAVRKSLQANGELYVTTTHDVLNFELGELRVEAKLLNDTRVLARREPRVVFRLGTRDNHLPRREDQGGGLWVAYAHDDSCKTLDTRTNNNSSTCRVSHKNVCTNLGIVFSIPSVQSDRLQVEAAVEVDRRDDVLEGRHDAFDSSDMLLLESQRSRSGRNLRRGWRGGAGNGVGRSCWSRDGCIEGLSLGVDVRVGQWGGPGERKASGLLRLSEGGSAGKGEAAVLLLLGLLILIGLLLLARIGAAKSNLTGGQRKRHVQQKNWAWECLGGGQRGGFRTAHCALIYVSIFKLRHPSQTPVT